MTDLISRADAIKTVIRMCSPICEWQDGTQQYPDCVVAEINALPSADAESDDLIIKGAKGIKDGLYNIKDGKLFKYKANGGTVRTYPIVPSADAVHGEWTPCGEKMPKELERVNVTWLNHNPPFYYQHIKDIPQTDTAVYYRGKWYWWDATVIDILAEYGEDCNAEQIDKDIVEVVAWMPLPTPYKGGDDE